MSTSNPLNKRKFALLCNLAINLWNAENTFNHLYFSFDLNHFLISLSLSPVTNPNNQLTSRVVSVTRSCAKSPEQADEFCKDTGFSFCEGD